jgi:hypothetical protein
MCAQHDTPSSQHRDFIGVFDCVTKLVCNEDDSTARRCE